MWKSRVCFQNLDLKHIEVELHFDRMSKDLKTAFPEMSGFSPRNIKYMRKFAQCWADYEIVQRLVAQIP